MLFAVLMISATFTSCNKDDDEVATTKCQVINKVTDTTLRDVTVVHLNSKGEAITSQYIGDIKHGASITFECKGSAFYLTINGAYATADYEVITGKLNNITIDDNTKLYRLN